MNTKAIETQVLIVGGGPIGLMGSLLLSRLGVKSLVVDLRGRTSTHPRSRLLDAPSVELMREVGVEQQVIDTGLGPDWTEYNRWFDSLAGKEICRVPTPSFHSVRTERSSSMPVMTAQDYVEAILYDKAQDDPNVDLRFDTTASGLTQTDSGVTCTIRDNRTGRAAPVSAEYAIGADGLRSSTRAAIGTELDADFMDVFFQDVIFRADFTRYTSDRQGGLLFIAHPMGAAVFQPLDGVRRWRCQIGGFDRTRKMTAEFAENWIRSALGTDEPVPIEVRTMTEWQFQPGRAGHLGKGRIFLAGDAAHVFIPTGGLGNNTGFVGIRNLAWKLAFVLRGASPASLLETYDAEHQPVAEQRVAAGRRNAQLSGGIFRAFHEGGDTQEAARNCRQYGEYEGLIYGYELASDLCARDDAPAPAVDNPVCDYLPVVRSGRRAPNLWLDGSWTRSVLDWNGLGYTAVLGAHVEPAPWQAAAGAIDERGFPIRVERLPEVDDAAPYDNEEIVLMRPDGIVADHWNAAGVEPGDEAERLARMLPLGAPAYDGINMASRGDVVSVTVNHRLNVFGYAGLGGVLGPDFERAGNAGMLDLVQSLEWVRDNIERFGGDPGNVLIFGESGGGAKVSTLLAMPGAAGLFHRAVIQSGPALRVSTTESATITARRLLDELGVGKGDADKLRKAPAERLLAASGAAAARAASEGGAGFRPVIGPDIPNHPFDPIGPEVSAYVPVMIGSNLHEVTLFVANDRELFELDEPGLVDRTRRIYGEDADEVLDTYRAAYADLGASDLYFVLASDGTRFRSIELAEAKIKRGGAPTYMYRFDWLSPAWDGRFRAAHAFEIPFVFGNAQLSDEVTGGGPDAVALAAKMRDAWIASAPGSETMFPQ